VYSPEVQLEFIAGLQVMFHRHYIRVMVHHWVLITMQ
jgi:hypothetical protein